ncbi:MAG TPA: redoxin domain-containing protein [Candidatus Baltobacteraceae bacterium]|jgi:thiol-disulfide isomerase/thioredoxin
MKRLSSVVLIAALFLVPTLVTAAEPDSILSFDGGSGWLNGAPISIADLRGKVVLVDFWEYTCINCLRTLPYLREWYKRYAADGFVIIGVHTPEFTFSSDPKNVEAATKRLGVTWPVVLDDKDVIWNRYGTTTWPHELLFDQTGKRNDSVIGEGGYTETEQRIQYLLKRANPSLQLPPIMALLPEDNYSKPGAVCYPKTEETFVGGPHANVGNAPPQAANGGLFDSQSSLQGLTSAMYYDKGSHTDGKIYLQGGWRKVEQGLVSVDGRPHVALKYHAIQVVGVMRPEKGAVTVIVTQDGKPVAHDDAGPDIQYDAQGRSYMTVDAPRAYTIINNKKWGTHDLTLEPQGSGVGMFSFDFESCEVPN